ncbi:uncharacterized protein F5891DRAFT_987464 [Suillus fuscotomentosus]|uniref:Uncharacterized protein n=1 Tax=Suillus fuscotomentosus TaxID=1912939 RepID=A0AAD4DQ51_9AGAM|nr:uncharacterized protein F5891DRAFT_987464 [Suillus fuscotomentosus]KAG1889084.1 hypothetical protein F5891DRAFT_987464 [Suillus fuscotomentosus]
MINSFGFSRPCSRLPDRVKMALEPRNLRLLETVLQITGVAKLSHEAIGSFAVMLTVNEEMDVLFLLEFSKEVLQSFPRFFILPPTGVNVCDQRKAFLSRQRICTFERQQGSREFISRLSESWARFEVQLQLEKSYLNSNPGDHDGQYSHTVRKGRHYYLPTKVEVCCSSMDPPRRAQGTLLPSDYKLKFVAHRCRIRCAMSESSHTRAQAHLTPNRMSFEAEMKFDSRKTKDSMV